MFHPFINEIERKSKTITHFLLAKRGPEARVKGITKGIDPEPWRGSFTT